MSQGMSNSPAAMANDSPAPQGGSAAEVDESATNSRAAPGRLRLMEFFRSDLQSGLTVALVAIPQCMAFATVAGLAPVAGLYAVVVMSLVSALLSNSPKLVVGPAITASTMCLAILNTVEPGNPDSWPSLAGTLAILVGAFTLLGALLQIGRFVRFVSRSVIVGLMVGSAILIFGSQLAPALGIPAATKTALLAGMLYETAGGLGRTHLLSLLVSAGTFTLILLAGRIGPKFPAAFAVLVLGAGVEWLLEINGLATGLETIGQITWTWPTSLTPLYPELYKTDLLVGAGAIALVGIIQSLAIAKAMAHRDAAALDSKREIWALGAANIAAGALHGFPGSGSFARSALADLAGARTRLSGVVSAVATILIVALGAALTQHITKAAIAGLLLATAISMVDWREFMHVMRHDRHDRIVLGTTLACVFFLPMHWAILLGLTVSILVFLHRVSQLHLVEMVVGTGRPFVEQPIDEQTGRSAVTILQLEGALFFAHADELATAVRDVLKRGPRVLVFRMRRTQHMDFSVIVALDRVLREYLTRGGQVVMCGLAPELRSALRESPLGRTIPSDYMLETTREVFGSAHLAIGLAESIARFDPHDDRPMYRVLEPTRTP